MQFSQCTRKLYLLLLIQGLFFTAASGQAADLILINANIRTMVSPQSRAQALAVKDTRILAIGTNVQIRKLAAKSTRVVDVRGRLLIPGFNDAHVHFAGIGNNFSTIPLRDAKTAADIAREVEHFVRFLPKERWILGSGWTARPDLTTIDKIAPDNPVFIYHADGQTAFANAVASKLAGLKNEAGIERDAAGAITGVVRGDALRRIAYVVPADHTRRWKELLQTASNFAASFGVTSAQDMHSDDLREVYRELEREGKLKTRVYDCISLLDWKKLSATPVPDSPMVRGGCLKSFADGDDASRTRLMRDIPGADKAGHQIMVHAIGEGSNANALKVFEETARLNGLRDRRFRLEHAHDPGLEDLPRFTTGVVASMQPYLFNYSPGGYYGRLLKQGSKIAFGSDAMITDLNPLLGIQAAVLAGDESIPIYEAVRAYTAGSAYAEFQEKEKGTLESGKLADLVILSDDIFVLQTGRLSDVRVVMTIVGGHIVFEKD